MEDLQVAPDVYRDADARAGGSEHRRSPPPAALRDTTGSGSQSVGHARAGRSEWTPAEFRRHKPRGSQPPRGAADPIFAILLVGLAAEAVVPWAAIWLSDWLVFNIPVWSLWLVFGVPAALTCVAVLIHWVLRATARRHAGRVRRRTNPRR